jgi:hypothetical protein
MEIEVFVLVLQKSDDTQQASSAVQLYKASIQKPAST